MRSVRDILRRNDGITIVFAVLLVILLLVMGGVIVSYGYSGYKRSVSDNADERNYQNVASATKLVRDEVVAEKKKQDDAIEKAPDDKKATVSASDVAGTMVSMLSKAHGLAGGGTTSQSLTVTPDTVDDDGNPSFAPVTVTVRKVSDGSYDVVCFETDNQAGTALHFSVSYTEEYVEVANKEHPEQKTKVLVKQIKHVGDTIMKVGQ